MPTVNSTYFNMVNSLRDKFNETHFTLSTWSNAVGFDQFTKNAINYAYMDILNAELEWPFLHQKTTFETIPGIRLYTLVADTSTTLTDLGFNEIIRSVDWESFYINPNGTVLTTINLLQTVPSEYPYEITVTTSDAISPLVPEVSVPAWYKDNGVVYNSDSTGLEAVAGDPNEGEYTIVGKDGTYRFNVDDAGRSVRISFVEAAPAVIATPFGAQFLPYMDYDLWRQTCLNTDLNPSAASCMTPQNVYKTQTTDELGLTPVPDKIYTITFEYWQDVDELSDVTDRHILPKRYENLILEGAAKYCYEFREDAQMSVQTDKRFQEGIRRMRIELINRKSTMNAGFYWCAHSKSYTLNTG